MYIRNNRASIIDFSKKTGIRCYEPQNSKSYPLDHTRRRSFE